MHRSVTKLLATNSSRSLASGSNPPSLEEVYENTIATRLDCCEHCQEAEDSRNSEDPTQSAFELYDGALGLSAPMHCLV